MDRANVGRVHAHQHVEHGEREEHGAEREAGGACNSAASHVVARIRILASRNPSTSNPGGPAASPRSAAAAATAEKDQKSAILSVIQYGGEGEEEEEEQKGWREAPARASVRREGWRGVGAGLLLALQLAARPRTVPRLAALPETDRLGAQYEAARLRAAKRARRADARTALRLAGGTLRRLALVGRARDAALAWLERLTVAHCATHVVAALAARRLAARAAVRAADGRVALPRAERVALGRDERERRGEEEEEDEGRHGECSVAGRRGLPLRGRALGSLLQQGKVGELIKNHARYRGGALARGA